MKIQAKSMEIFFFFLREQQKITKNLTFTSEFF